MCDLIFLKFKDELHQTKYIEEKKLLFWALELILKNEKENSRVFLQQLGFNL